MQQRLYTIHDHTHTADGQVGRRIERQLDRQGVWLQLLPKPGARDLRTYRFRHDQVWFFEPLHESAEPRTVEAGATVSFDYYGDPHGLGEPVIANYWIRFPDLPPLEVFVLSDGTFQCWTAEAPVEDEDRINAMLRAVVDYTRQVRADGEARHV